MHPATDTDDELAQRYFYLLHRTCPKSPRKRFECSWTQSGVCAKCGRHQPTLLPNQPGSLS